MRRPVRRPAAALPRILALPRVLALPLAALLLAAAPACAPERPQDADPDAAAFVDDAGRSHRPDSGRNRIISLVPSITETLVAMGAGPRLIARTQYDAQPELARLPVISGVLDPSVEALFALDPDLVAMWPSGGDGGAVGRRMDDVGIDWYGAAAQTVADFERHARGLGRMLSLERAADSVIAATGAELLEAARSRTGREPVKVFYLVQMDPLITVGPATFLDSIFTAAGAVNVFSDIDGHWPLVSPEQVVWRNPDYVVVPVSDHGVPRVSAARPDPSLKRLAAHPAWSSLPAVAGGRVRSVDASLFGRPGPRMGEAARYLAHLLHGTEWIGLEERPDGSGN